MLIGDNTRDRKIFPGDGLESRYLNKVRKKGNSRSLLLKISRPHTVQHIIQVNDKQQHKFKCCLALLNEMLFFLGKQLLVVVHKQIELVYFRTDVRQCFSDFLLVVQ